MSLIASPELFYGSWLYTRYGDGEHFERRAELIVTDFSPSDVLVVGCAFGFLVRSLRDRGVDAWGCDISEWAISQAAPEVAPYLAVADGTKARDLRSFSPIGRFDLVVIEDVITVCDNEREALKFLSAALSVSEQVLNIVTPYNSTTDERILRLDLGKFAGPNQHLLDAETLEYM